MPRVDTLEGLRNSIENDETSVELCIELHNSGDVAAAIKVVRGTPDSNETLIFEPILMSFLDQLVGPADEF